MNIHVTTCSTTLTKAITTSYPSHVLPGNRRLSRLRYGRSRWHRIGNCRGASRYHRLKHVEKSGTQSTDSRDNSGRLQSHGPRLAALRQRSTSQQCLPRPGRHLRQRFHRSLLQESTGSLRTDQHPLCQRRYHQRGQSSEYLGTACGNVGEHISSKQPRHLPHNQALPPCCESHARHFRA